jgi:hypothetical protein
VRFRELYFAELRLVLPWRPFSVGEHFFRELPLEFSSGGTVHNSVNADAWDVEGARESTAQRVKFDGVVELMRLRRLRAPKNPGQQSAY